MLDIKLIREQPQLLDYMLVRRGMHAQSENLLAMDTELRSMQKRLDALRHQHKANSKQPPSYNKDSNSVTDNNNEPSLKDQISQLSSKHSELELEFQKLFLSMPNWIHPDVPDSNRVIRYYDSLSIHDDRNHETHEQFINREKGVRIAGSRFVVLEGQVAALARRLGNWLIEQNVKAGYQELHVPYIMNQEIAQGMGVLPKFAEDLFQLTNGQYLIPTSEGPIVGSYYKQEVELPRLYTALTPCFRSEAGSAGKDTIGLIRLHQFSKVEVAGFVPAEHADYYHNLLVEHVESLLRKLKISYRVVEMGADDLGFHAYKKYDVEVWMPGMGRYLEISSISQCLDFQSRRLGIKNRPLPHTINGSALPIERLLAVILETHGPDFILPEV